MNKSFRLNQLAISMSMILGSSFLLSPALANTCAGTAFTGTCGLTQYDMTSPITPKPTAWYFTQKTQDAAIDGTAGPRISILPAAPLPEPLLISNSFLLMARI